MIRTLEIVQQWDGGDTRQQPASVTVEYRGDGQAFDTQKGVFYQVRPGGGDWPEVEAVASFVLTGTKLDIKSSRTGGQNHTIWLALLGGITENDIFVNQTGPITVTSGIKDVPLA